MIGNMASDKVRSWCIYHDYCDSDEQSEDKVTSNGCRCTTFKSRNKRSLNSKETNNDSSINDDSNISSNGRLY